ncbi:hypothetical protein KFU94_14715 [Chloroflexi bacterium TSY]|nr:hypothetical protein [Chloroflexi bacterium TSY]
MGFLTPFIIGFIAGGFAMWQRGRRKQQASEVARAEEAEIIAIEEAFDDLTAIHGIGPIYAERLNAAGIQSLCTIG